MRKTLQILGAFLFLSLGQVGFGQTSTNAVRLNSGAEVSNTIFYKNTRLSPVSNGVSVKHSALDSITAGIRTIHLLSDPFSAEYRINWSSPAYNTGINTDLRTHDTLDLDYGLRVSGENVDMGAFEYQVTVTNITLSPTDTATCEGTPLTLFVEADGDAVTYQWQKNNVSLLGETASTLTLAGNRSDSGQYRVIAIGACCNDTSEWVSVSVDVAPQAIFRVMNDTSVVEGDSVLLWATMLSNTGTITWYKSDFTTKITDLKVAVTETDFYICVAKNGACSNEIVKPITIFLKGSSCVLETHNDTMLCHGDYLRLQMNTATVDYYWRDLQTGDSLPKFTMIYPDTTSRYVAISLNGEGAQCSDTLEVRVHKVNFWVMDDQTVCGTPGGNMVCLASIPQCTWYREGSDVPVGIDPCILVPNNVKSVFVATWYDGICLGKKQVTITSNPPKLRLFSEDTVVCAGESVLLSSNLDPSLVTWIEKSSRDTMTELLITPTADSTVFEAWVFDSLCGNIHKEVVVRVQAKPQFEIQTPNVVCENELVYLQASPAAIYFTTMSGKRVSNPVSIAEDTARFIGWYTFGACTVSDTTVISTVDKPTFSVCADTAIVKNTEAHIYSTPLATEWTAVGESQSYGCCDLQVRPQQTTTYIAELRTEVCGVFRKSVTVTVLDTFFVTVTANSNCYEEGWASVDVFGATGPYTFVWNNDSTLTSDTIRGLKPGNYSVAVTDRNERTETKMFSITAASPIKIAYTVVEPKNENCDGGQIKVTATGGTPGYTYTWSDLEDYENENLSNGNYRTGLDAGIYMVTVTDSNGCTQTHDRLLLPCVYKQIMPTLFITPNGDGKNEYLKIKNIDHYPINRVIVINSYGEEVNSLKDYNNEDVKWNGRNKKGEVLPDGVYYYIVEAEGVRPMVGWLLMKASKSK